MPLYVQNGNLLNKTGTLGTSVGCCCDQPPPPLPECNCGGTFITIPSAVTLEVDVGNLWSNQGGTCSDADFRAYWNGTYTLSYTRSDFGGYIYEASYSDGRYVNVLLKCDGIPSFVVRSCDLSLCIRRSGQGYSFGLGTPAICAVPTGTYTSADRIVYDRPLLCSDTFANNGRTYDVDFTLEYIW
jgi:hypothetical protein